MTPRTLIAAAILTFSLSALAHDAIGPHGGRITDAGDYHVEMVAKESVLDVFISDAAEKPVAPAGFKGVAILVVDGKPQRIPLEPTADNRLSGKASVTLPASPKGVVQFTAPSGKSAQAKFN